MGDVGTAGIRFNLLTAGVDRQIHVFHGDGSQENVLSKHQGSDKAEAIAKGHLDRPHIGNGHRASVGHRHLPQGFGLQLEFQGKGTGMQSISALLSASARVWLGRSPGSLGLLSSMEAWTYPIDPTLWGTAGLRRQ